MEDIKETKEYDSSIRNSNKPWKAQIWTAMALLNHKINTLSIENKKYKIFLKEKTKILIIYHIFYIY